MKNNKSNYTYLIILLLVFSFVNTGNAQELQELIREGLSNNAQIKSLALKHKRATESINQVNYIPNTQFNLGYFISEPETRTGAQRFKISANQMLPWFGTIASREDYKTALADVEFQDLIIAKKKLSVSIAQAYYKLVEKIDTKNSITAHLELVNQYEKMALTNVETGKATVVDVLQLQIRKNELEQKKEFINQDVKSIESTINKLLNRTNHTPILVKSNLIMPNSIKVKKENLKLHPELAKYDKLYHSVTQMEALNKKENNPMIGFGLNYINVENRPNLNFTDNGKDIIMPMLSVSIPLFNKKHKSITKQNKLKQDEINYSKQERLNTLNTILEKAINNRNKAKINYTTAVKNLKQANNAEKILLKNYETETIDYTTVLTILELQLKFDINKIEAIKNYYTQSTIINYLTH